MIGLVATVSFFRADRAALGTVTAVIALSIFIYLVIRHRRVHRHLRYVDALRSINVRGAQRITGQWGNFDDAGEAFRDDRHPYASDLDLFGKGSLYQWINSTTTAKGSEALARLLTRADEMYEQAPARQAAVDELATRLPWRQRFEAEGRLTIGRVQSAEPLLQWAEQAETDHLHLGVRFAIRLLPLVTTLTFILYAFGVLPGPLAAMLVLAHVVLITVKWKEHGRVLSVLYQQEAHLEAYSRMLGLFENRPFQSQWLRERQKCLRDVHGNSACAQVAKLSKIVERMSNRENVFFVVFNVWLLWDYQCMAALAVWKSQSGPNLRMWLETLGEVEALASLANIRFEHPDWAFPTIVDEPLGLKARQLGHPLITRNRVCNDFELTSGAPIALITGSNMAGKSTFLRTVGINLVLAYAGSPVCASTFRCSPMKIWTSMRTVDNLAESTSSFYAEVLRMKRIVEAARKEERLLCLLDEIFKGTNSFDRHRGAKALIMQLLGDGAFGMVSTHDLELGALEVQSEGKIKNHHFREFYRDGKIHFDYRLRPGVSTTRNALYLIKMMGIEAGDDHPVPSRD